MNGTVALAAPTAPPIAPETWPRLVFTEGAHARLVEVARFLNELSESGQSAAGEIEAEFVDRMQYLNDFGGSVGDDDPRRRFRVTLGYDWAPLSFSLRWDRLDLSTGEYVYAFNGGFIWHGGSNDPLCVSLVPQYWGIHT